MIARAIAIALVSLGAAGCYWSSPPTNPYPHEPFDVARLPELTEPRLAPLRSSRVIVYGRFQSVASQPIGGLYDEREYSLSPLYRTYAFPDVGLELFEQSCDALRATGLDVRKDYSVADTRLLEPRLRALAPVTVSTVLLSVQHDQIRTEEGRDVEAARLVARVTVRGPAMHERYRKDIRVEGRRPSNPDADVLGALGRSLGAALVADADFLRAVEATR
ncbi:MAG TPA: hypothetical protein VHB21_12540 [Minicystis sp.]|nr:hypothetical protein [Minicystis sp.]